MARVIVWDDRLYHKKSDLGLPPWQSVNATCIVRSFDSMGSIVSWVAGKAKKYGGLSRLFILAHGRPGRVQLGRDELHLGTVHLWAKLARKIDHIIILACSVAGKEGTALEGDGSYMCAQLAGYARAKVTAANVTQWFTVDLDTEEIDFGAWEGIVYTFAPNGSCVDVYFGN